MLRVPASRRLALLATVCAFGGLALPASAQTSTTIAIDPGQILSGSVAATVDGDSLGSIVGLLDATGSAVATQELGNALLFDITLGADLLVSGQFQGSPLFAVTRGNTGSALLGLLPDAPDSPPDAALGGGALLVGGVLRDTTLLALAEGNQVALTGLATEPATVDLDLDASLIVADTAFNTALASIEALSSLALRSPVGPAAYDDFGTVLVELQASLSVANTQINSAPSNDDSQSPDPGQPLASALTRDNAVSLTLAPEAGEFIGGSAGLDGNRIQARAGGNVFDGSILLRTAIATAAGDLAGPDFFGGTALVYSLQNSDDVNDPDEDFLGEGIVALNSGSTILGSVSAGSDGQDSALLDSFRLDLSDNRLGAQAILNEARSEIGFDGAMTLQGSDAILDQGAGDASVLLQERLALRSALADYLIVARQTGNRREAVDPVAYALLVEGEVSGQLTTPAAFAALSLEGNALEASAGGNSHTALLHNRLDGEAGSWPLSVDATLAVVNWQWVTAPDIAASVAGTGTAIRAAATLLAPLGDQGASLDLLGNAVVARASGNAGTAQVVFTAEALSLDLATDGPAGASDNAGAQLFSERGGTNAGDTFGATAGGVITSYQILDSASADHQEQDFLLPGVAASVLDSALVASLTTAGPRAADSLVTLTLDASANLVEARAYGSSFQGQAALAAGGLFTGSLGLLGVQIDNAQSVVAAAADRGLEVTLDASASADADLAASLEVNGNSALVVAGVNASSLVGSLEAGRLAAGGRSSLYDAGDPATALGGLIEGYQFNAFRVTRHASYANAAFALLNDQTADEADAIATLEASGIVVELLGDPAIPLENVALQVSGNRQVAQARLNEAGNSLTLDIATLAEVDPAAIAGPLAGIVSFQGSGQGYVPADDQVDLEERESIVTAQSSDSGITILLPLAGASAIEVQGNLMAATAAANVVQNSVAVAATSLRAGLDEPPLAAILDNDNATDFDLAVLGSVFIANSQRNEWQLFGGGPGPSVTALLDGTAGIRVVSSGELADSLVALTGNSLLSQARATVAQNVISLAAVTLEASGQIVSRQGNGGDVSATTSGAVVSLELNAGPGTDASEASVIVIEDNAIEAMALGNAVLNAIEATAQGSFAGVTGTAPVINEELPATEGETSVEADYAILNRQVNRGTEEDPVEVTSLVEGGLFVVNLNGNHDATAVYMDGNSVAATAYGNNASNSITLRSAGGDMPSAAIVNQQSNSYATISATVTGSGVSVALGGAGAGASVVSGSNSVSATAIGNAAVNSVVTRSGGPTSAN